MSHASFYMAVQHPVLEIINHPSSMCLPEDGDKLVENKCMAFRSLMWCVSINLPHN